MTTMELKNKIISQIKNSNNIHLLKELNHLLNMEESEPYQLNEHQKNSVEEARKDIEKSNTYTNDEVRQKVNKWLKE